MELYKGQPVALRLREEIKEKVSAFKQKGIIPKLAVLRVGTNPEDIAYEQRVLKNCVICDILAEAKECPADITTEAFLSLLDGYNRDESVHGILIFRPLPQSIDQEAVSLAISANKDSDCMNPQNLNKLFLGNVKGVLPCTPEAVRELLLHYVGSLVGKNIVIVNRSLVLGKPLAMLLLEENATVTICHSKTKELSDITKKADIVVTGVGRAAFFGKEYFGPHSIVIDVGINEKEGGITGDVDLDAVSGLIKGISPVPGGVGAVTSMLLLRNVLFGICEA
ncbi:MAG: bifunctional 5,10-methylenetetrahydrofolate dehydrogenase/5,10-methenyltetrahydrofolate cyclohydrolase [Eubacteriales bacterium]|nr:bifunctional 5,10-methylenetetrahydrofolate dehydrogenase/5,10-methenyltetrahydrofolate cyclohydrolase [Eubacteriales bacterium]